MKKFHVKIDAETQCFIDADFFEIDDGVAIFYSEEPPNVCAVIKDYRIIIEAKSR